MSSWILALKDLHRLGGIAGFSLIGDNEARNQLSRHGLAKPIKRTRRKGLNHDGARTAKDGERLWALTEKGRNVAEGRVAIVRSEHNKISFAATWLLSLPQLRITPEPTVATDEPPRPPPARMPTPRANGSANGNANHPWRMGINRERQ